MLFRSVRTVILRRFDTQAEFAAAVGHPESFVSNVIRGRRTLSNEKAKRWCEVLGCRTCDLMPVLDATRTMPRTLMEVFFSDDQKSDIKRLGWTYFDRL